MPRKIRHLSKKLLGVDNLLEKQKSKHLRELNTHKSLVGFLSNVTSGHEDPSLERPFSQCVTAGQIRSPIFYDWCERINHKHQFHRKLWEWIYILQSLEFHGKNISGSRGLGFGVGKERLVSYLAGLGCEILATDADDSVAEKSGWKKSDQHIDEKADLNQFGLCDRVAFDKLVTYRHMDMRSIDPELEGFDFLWSSCAFEHLGSIGIGIDFVLESMECLKPGGVAVHTTELNIGSIDQTIQHGHTVLYRRADILRLVDALSKMGHKVEPVNWSLGRTEEDFSIQMPWDIEKSENTNLKMSFGDFVTTSFGLTVTKGGDLKE